ncbi:MAG: hypothetical protein ACJA1H_003042, partial [Glaciecola sp.]
AYLVNTSYRPCASACALNKVTSASPFAIL